MGREGDAVIKELLDKFGNQEEIIKIQKQFLEKRQRQNDATHFAIAAGKSVGTKSAREVAEMMVGRKVADPEWDEIKEPWERNWH